MIQQGIAPQNSILTETRKALELLEKSKFLFWPTGSRVFRPFTVREETDFDFFAQDGVEIKLWLLRNGFRTRGWYFQPKDYPIPDATQGLVGLCERGDVDVQLVVDIDEKARIQAILIPQLSSQFYAKGEMVKLWRTAYQLYRGGATQQRAEF